MMLVRFYLDPSIMGSRVKNFSQVFQVFVLFLRNKYWWCFKNSCEQKVEKEQKYHIGLLQLLEESDKNVS